MNFFVVLDVIFMRFPKMILVYQGKGVWGLAGPKNGWKRWKMAKIAIFEIFENFFGLQGIPSPWIFLLYWMYIYLGFPKMMSIFQFLMSIGSSGPKKWPPLAQNFFEIFFFCKNPPKTESSIQDLSIDTQFIIPSQVDAEIFKKKSAWFGQIAKFWKWHSTPPRGPRSKIFWGFEQLPRGNIWAKYEQNRWCEGS